MEDFSGHQIRMRNSRKILFLNLTYVMCTQKNRLNEPGLLGTPNSCFNRRVRIMDYFNQSFFKIKIRFILCFVLKFLYLVESMAITPTEMGCAKLGTGPFLRDILRAMLALIAYLSFS